MCQDSERFYIISETVFNTVHAASEFREQKLFQIMQAHRAVHRPPSSTLFRSNRGADPISRLFQGSAGPWKNSCFVELDLTLCWLWSQALCKETGLITIAVYQKLNVWSAFGHILQKSFQEQKNVTHK